MRSRKEAAVQDFFTPASRLKIVTACDSHSLLVFNMWSGSFWEILRPCREPVQHFLPFNPCNSDLRVAGRVLHSEGRTEQREKADLQQNDATLLPISPEVIPGCHNILASRHWHELNDGLRVLNRGNLPNMDYIKIEDFLESSTMDRGTLNYLQKSSVSKVPGAREDDRFGQVKNGPLPGEKVVIPNPCFCRG